MKFKFVPLHVVIEEIRAEHHRHYSEMTDGDEYGMPDVDWELYEALSRAGHMYAAIMYDHKLQGYAAFSLGTNPRYRSRMEAECHALFVEAEHRAKWSKRFIEFAVEQTRKLGAMETNFTESDPRVGKWLSRSGAKAKYTIWSMSHGQ